MPRLAILVILGARLCVKPLWRIPEFLQLYLAHSCPSCSHMCCLLETTTDYFVESFRIRSAQGSRAQSFPSFQCASSLHLSGFLRPSQRREILRIQASHVVAAGCLWCSHKRSCQTSRKPGCKR